MGWTSSSNWTNKSKVIDELKKGYSSNGFSLIDYASTKEGAYFYVHTEDAKFIVCVMIEKHGGEYAIKSITESMGPFMIDCPERFLKYEKTVSGHSDEWRKNVKEFHDRKRNAKEIVKIGQNIELYGQHYLVVGKVKNSFIIEQKTTKQRFKMGPKDALRANISKVENLKDKIEQID